MTLRTYSVALEYKEQNQEAFLSLNQTLLEYQVWNQERIRQDIWKRGGISYVLAFSNQLL